MSEKRLIEISVLTGDLEGSRQAWSAASSQMAEVSGGEGRIMAGDVLLRLLSPEAGTAVAEMIERHGEGLFELVIEVNDVAGAMTDLRTKGVLVSGVAPGEDRRREIRLDPASTHGVPIRIVEKK